MPNTGPELTYIGADETDPRKVLLKKDGAYLRTSLSVWNAAQAVRANDHGATQSIPLAILDAASKLLEPEHHARTQRAQPRARIEINLKKLIVSIAARLPSAAILNVLASAGAAVTAAYLTTANYALSPTISVIVMAEIAAAMFVIMAIHELAHASVATRYGCSTHRLGIGIFFILPVFYADVSEVWRLSRPRRLAVNAAGIVAQLAINLPLVAVTIVFPASIALKGLIWTNLASIGLNLIPFAKLDGYWLLADAIGIPDLQARAFSALRHPHGSFGGRTCGHERFIAFYALAGLLFYAAIAAAVLANLASIGGSVLQSRRLGEVSAAAANRPLAWLFALYIVLWIFRFALKLMKDRNS